MTLSTRDNMLIPIDKCLRITGVKRLIQTIDYRKIGLSDRLCQIHFYPAFSTRAVGKPTIFSGEL